MCQPKGASKTYPPYPSEDFSPPLDAGIAKAVLVLRAAGVETFESCEGGVGHPCPEPLVRFFGNAGAGHYALGVAISNALPVSELRRTWDVDGECPTGPYWDLVFRKQVREDSASSKPTCGALWAGRGVMFDTEDTEDTRFTASELRAIGRWALDSLSGGAKAKCDLGELETIYYKTQKIPAAISKFAREASNDGARLRSEELFDAACESMFNQPITLRNLK